MKRKIIPIVLASLLLGLGFDWMFYGKVPGISVIIYTSSILVLTFYLARVFRQSLNRSLYWLAPVILFFSLMVFVRANAFLAFINIVLILYLLILVARLANQPTIKLSELKVAQYFSLVGRVPLRILGEFFQVLQRAMNNRNNSAIKSSYAPIVRGLLLSLPIFIVFLLLLSSADLVFKKYIDSLFDLNVAPETIFRWGLIGLVTSLFVGAYALIFMPSSKPETAPTGERKKFNLGTTESSIILGSVSLLFFVFVMIQLAYLFGGSDQITSTGYTYAEYARKGFFELIVVAAISLLLIWTIKRSSKFRTLLQAATFKWLSGILIAEVMVIMLSAHNRLNLYEEAYGFTTLRLLSHLFILWLAVAFILLFVHILRKQTENLFVFQLFLSAISFFVLINLINIDSFIARQNINRLNDVGKLDIYYMGNLSEDAVPATAGLLNHPNEKVRKAAAHILYSQRQYSAEEFSDWQSTNIARERANKIFRDNAVQINAGESYTEFLELNLK